MARRKLRLINGKTEDDSNGGDTASHNVNNRAEIIRDVCRDLARLEAERKAISADIAELKQTKIKGELGMKIVDFNIGYRLYQLEGDDRDTLFDTLRETFEALGVGQQLDFLGALAKQKETERANGIREPNEYA